MIGGQVQAFLPRTVGRVRSDSDTWDITTSVGSTALFVAIARALEAGKPDPVALDPYAEVFCRAAGDRYAEVLDAEESDHQLRSADFGRYFVDYQAARTKYFDTYFARVAEAGVQQVVLLAAGLDSRAYRLHWADGTVIFEIDQPQVLEFKRTVLAQYGAQPRAERREVAVDLRDDWQQALRHAGFDPDRPSAWIAEGLLIYLPAAAQEQLFAGIDALTAPGSFVAVEDTAPLDDEHYRVMLEAEQASGDSERIFFQLVYNERCAPATEWFAERGWTAIGTPLADYVRAHGRQLPASESEAMSIFSRNTLVSATK